MAQTLQKSCRATLSGVRKRVVLADVSRYQKPERGYIRMFPGTKNRNEGTCGCSPVPKTGTRAHSPKPPFYEAALLFPLGVVLVSMGHRTIVARYVAKWGIAQMCQCETEHQGGYHTILGEC